MKTKNNDEPLIFAMSLAAGLAVIGLTWHYVMVSVMPPQVRMNMWNLTQEAWSYRDNFSAYLVWRFPPMVAEGYPFAFMAAVLPGVLVYGGIVAARHRHWISLAQAAAGWLAGGIVGFFLMAWVPMPNILLTVFAMPGLAFLAGSLAPVLLAPVQDRSVVRGTRVRRHFSNTLKTIQAAEKSGRTVLAGMMLDPAAETQHLVTIGVTGSGKSVALLALMHTAMHRGDRHIVADPDGSAMRLFYREGDVILNPADARSAKWDILAEITEDSDYRFLAESVLPYPKGDEDNEWVTYAQEIFAPACRPGTSTGSARRTPSSRRWRQPTRRSWRRSAKARRRTGISREAMRRCLAASWERWRRPWGACASSRACRGRPSRCGAGCEKARARSGCPTAPSRYRRCAV